MLIHAKDPHEPDHHWWELPGGGAHVALLARHLQAIVLTSDPDDLPALDDTLTLVTV